MVKRTKNNLMSSCESIILKLNEVIDDLLETKRSNFNFYSYLLEEKISLDEIEYFNSSAFYDILKLQAKEFDDFVKTKNSLFAKSFLSEYDEKEIYRIRNFLCGLLESSEEYAKIKKQEQNTDK